MWFGSVAGGTRVVKYQMHVERKDDLLYGSEYFEIPLEGKRCEVTGDSQKTKVQSW